MTAPLDYQQQLLVAVDYLLWELIALGTTTHSWVINWWSLPVGRRLWDHKFFHLMFLAILYSSEVLATLLLCNRGL